MLSRRITPVLLVGLLTLLALAPHPAATAAGSTVLARGTLASIPEGEFIFRSFAITLEATAPPLTHVHGTGMNYAVAGPHLLTLDSQQTTLQPGQAAWIAEQVEHTHATNGTTPSRWLFLYVLRPASERGAGAPVAPALGRTLELTFESEVLRFSHRGAHEAILVADTYQAGATGAVQAYGGPTQFIVDEGTITLQTGSQAQQLHAGDYAMVQAGTPVQVRADAHGTARVLTLALVPAGQPVAAPALPATGVDAWHLPSLVLATVLLLGAGVALQRGLRRRQR